MTETAIWFDLDGTLLAVGDYGTILERACERAGIEGEDRTDFVEVYQSEFFDLLQDVVAEPYTRAATAGVEETSVDVDPESFVETLLETECERTRVPDTVRETLETLGETNDLGVLTNGVTKWQQTKLQHHDLTEQLDAVVVSEEAGAHKPRAAPFELAERRLPAEERWMVGDDREADVEGARSAGWSGIHVSDPTDVPDVVDRL
jgi:putative hydrolase of the HAD superfamily